MRFLVDFEFMSIADDVELTGPAHQCPWAAVREAVVPEVVAATANAWARDEATKACIGATSVRFIGCSNRVRGLWQGDSLQRLR